MEITQSEQHTERQMKTNESNISNIEILRKSLETFTDVFGNNVTYGVFDSKSKEIDADFVFLTNLTMCKSLELFDRNEFVHYLLICLTYCPF